MTKFQIWRALKKIAKLNNGPLVDGDLWYAINEVLEGIGLGYKHDDGR